MLALSCCYFGIGLDIMDQLVFVMCSRDSLACIFDNSKNILKTGCISLTMLQNSFLDVPEFIVPQSTCLALELSMIRQMSGGNLHSPNNIHGVAKPSCT
ncbi:hypothetical protein NPIL_307011 [Nephila pilipes]|uniref:Uncharacterized protein n=1 Tax=Nephila pilipes TaxID=299642 RepID=A0A8X6SXZ4_NEPPI|nr:hypothetical protein NPIL_307011 [Nephila pilipes]